MENNKKKKAPELRAAVNATGRGLRDATYASGRGLRNAAYATGRSVRWAVPQVGQILREAAPGLLAVAALVGANATINKKS